LQYADASLKKDRDVVLAAVQQNGLALQHADASLKKDRDVVLAAVQQNGLALQSAIEAKIKINDKEQPLLQKLIELFLRHKLQNNLIEKLWQYVDQNQNLTLGHFCEFIFNQSTAEHPKNKDKSEITITNTESSAQPKLILANSFLIELACIYHQTPQDKVNILPIPQKSCRDFFSCFNPFASTCLSSPIAHDSQQIGDTVLYHILKDKKSWLQNWMQLNSNDLNHFIKNNASSLVTYLKENQNIDPDIYKKLMIIARFHSNQLNQVFIDEVFNNLVDKKNIAIANDLLEFLQDYHLLTGLNDQQTNDFYELKKSLLEKMAEANRKAKENNAELPFSKVELYFFGFPSTFSYLGESNRLLFFCGSDIIKQKAE